MGVETLPVVAQLGNRSRLAVGDEDRVVAEAVVTVRRVGDAPREHAGAAVFVAVGRERDELADITRVAARVAGERIEHPARLVAAGPARRLDTRAPVEALDLDPRVLAERPRVRLERAREARLLARVVVVRPAVLRPLVVGVERLDLPGGEQRAQLPQLALVSRGEPGC